MRVLVTGAAGFVGKHLVSELAKSGHFVYAVTRENGMSSTDWVQYVNYNILSQEEVFLMLNALKPEGIIHLAAQSNVKAAWELPSRTLETNILSTIYLVEGIKKCIPEAKLITIGSSEEYGWTAQKGEPLTEEHSCLPQNPYASSKFVAGQVMLQLAGKDKLNMIHVRPFNHFGPGQKKGFVVSDFASQIARIEQSLQPPIIEVGDLSAQRDFSHVRDIIHAYILLLESEVPVGIYNVCSGTARSIQSIVKAGIKI